MLQWLLQHQPPHFITQATTLWKLLRALGTVWAAASQVQSSSPLLSLAVQVMPIGQAYMQLQVPTPGEAATGDASSNRNSSSSRQSTKASFETLQKAISRYQSLVMTNILFSEFYRVGWLQGPLPAVVQALQKQLLFGPASHVAAVKLTAACRYLHDKHGKSHQQQRHQQQRGGRRRASSSRVTSSSWSRSGSDGGQGSSSSSSTSSSSRHVPDRISEECLAKESASSILLPPDHELIAAVLGENAVATV